MIRVSWVRLCLILVATAAAVTTSAPMQAAADGESAAATQTPTIERRLGEEEQIRHREEWFRSTREQGTKSAQERADLRLDAVRQTREALQLQKQLRSDGRAAGTNPWSPMGPSPSTFGGWAFGTVSGRTTALAGDWAGGVIYLGTAAGGLWKSFDDGQTWSQLFDAVGTMTVGAVAVDPNNANVVWAGTGDNVVGCESYFGLGIVRSLDGGLTWEQRNGSGANTLQELATFANVIVDPRNSDRLVVGGRIRQCGDGSGFAGGIYTTTDAGLNWTNALSGRQVYEIAQDPSVLDTYWAATDNGIYKSVNNGDSWTLMNSSGLPNGGVGRCELAISPSDSSTVYALFASGPALWRTQDGGATWTQRTSGSNACDGQCWYNMVLRVHNTDPDTLYRGTIRSFKSVDGGANWSDLTGGWGSGQKVHQDTHVMVMDPNNNDKFYVGTDGGLWKSEDAGVSFSNLNGNTNSFLFYAIGVAADDPDLICGGAQDNSSVARSSSNVWGLQAVTGDGFTCHFNPQNSNYSYITSYPSGGLPNVWRSTTGAFGGYSDISSSGNGIIPNDRINWVTPYQIDPVNPNILYLGTHRIYRSDDFGSNWTQLGPDLTGSSGSLLNIDINRNFPDTVMTSSGSGRVWITHDGAQNWTNLTSGLPGRSVNDIASDPTSTDRAFAVVGGFNTSHVWEWNAGSGWVAKDSGLPNVPHNTVLMLSSEDIMVGNDVGVYRSFDGGDSWVPWMENLPQGLVVTDLKYNLLQNKVTAGTYGRGAWQTTLGPVSPILLFEQAMTPQELDGNGNGIAEPGETWGVELQLRNGGGATALSPSGVLMSTTPGVTLSGGGVVQFADILPGGVSTSTQMATFVIDPDVTCGATPSFDLVGLTTTNDPGPFNDFASVVSIAVGGNLPPVASLLVDDDLEPSAPAAWSHEAINANQPGCATSPYIDEWTELEKDVAFGNSFHAGRGPGSVYLRKNYAWLYYNGKDSAGGAGLQIPADAISASLVFDHLYDTVAGLDGGVVLIDFLDDGNDNYQLLTPIGGYPTNSLQSGQCNALEGMPAFSGDSNGWTTSTFDLGNFAGNTVHIAFVFGSDQLPNFNEGWYVDNVRLEIEQAGASVCEVTSWPGSVAADVQFEVVAPGEIEASWGDACNAGTVGQQYSVQVGDLDQLRATAVYNHAPIQDACDLTSPTTFSYTPGLQYFLVVPNDGVREGGAGVDSSGAPRPTLNLVCGETRVESCDN